MDYVPLAEIDDGHLSALLEYYRGMMMNHGIGEVTILRLFLMEAAYRDNVKRNPKVDTDGGSRNLFPVWPIR